MEAPFRDGAADPPLPSTNGHGKVHAEQGGASLLPDGLDWQLSYDRESLERFAASAAAERARLQGEIDAARARVAAARAARGPGDLTELIQAAQQELDEIEREQRELIRVIRATAEAEATRLVAEAKQEAEALRALGHRFPGRSS